MNQIIPSVAVPQAINSGKHNAKVDQGRIMSQPGISGKAAEVSKEELEKKVAEQEIDKYLTLISRLENQLKKDELSEEDLNKILTSLEAKILSLPKKSQELLFKIKELKEMEVNQVSEFKEKLKEMLTDDKDREQAIKLLKNKEFIALIREEPPQPKTYGPAKA